MPPVDLTLAICTAERPDLCADLVGDVTRADPGTWSREVLLVDNGVVQPVGELPSTRRVVAPPRNIARARNVALAEAAGRLILWLDDDQRVGPDFFVALERAWHHRPSWSRGVRLHVEPLFEGPATPVARRFYTSRSTPEGAEIRRPGFSTNGLLVERDALARCAGPTDEGPFDPWFGRRGAEDTDLFLRARAHGLRFSYTRLVSVGERISAARAQLSYMLERSFRIGFTDTVLDLRQSPRAHVGVRAVVRLGLEAGLVPVAAAAGAAAIQRRALALGTVAGRLWALANGDFEHYRAP